MGKSRLLGLLVVALSLLAVALPAPAQLSMEGGPENHYTTLWDRGEYHAALQALEAEIAALEPTIPSRLRLARARLRFAQGIIPEAIEDLTALAEQRPQPSYSLELALMYRYQGAPLLYDKWLKRAANQTRGRSWFYQRRSENVAAFGSVAELMGTNPKTILSAHYGRAFEYFTDLSAVPYVAAGGLAYRNGGYDIAEGYYLQALEKEPENQDALSGIAHCYWKSHDPRLEPTLKKLLGINPNHPAGNGIVVERMLELGDTVPALEIINAQLEINPVNHQFRALKAAAHFIDDDLDAMQTVIDAVAEFNPVWSEIYRTPGRLASRHYRFKEGVDFQEKALACDPTDYEARALYTLDLMRLGRETEGRVELEIAFEADPYNVQLYNLLQLMDTIEQFTTIERDAFVLRLPEDEEPIMAEAALDLLDEAITQMEEKYDVVLEKPVLIEMFDNHDDFMVRSVGLPGNAGHLGICFGKLVTMDAPSVRPKGSSNWRSVLWHEFVHVVTLQKTKNRMPRWLSEGISVFEEQERSKAWSNRLNPEFRGIIAEELPDLASIDGFFTAPKSGGHLMFGYFVAGDFVQFYVDTYGHDALVATLASIGSGERAEAALVTHAGTTREALDAAFEKHLTERFQPFENLPQPRKNDPRLLDQVAQQFLPQGVPPNPAAEPAEPPSSPFTDAMREAGEAAEAEDWEAAEAALLRAWELFPDYAAADAPLRRLATLYRDQGRVDKYIETIERVAFSSPQELDASNALLQLYVDEQNWEALARQADWSLGIDPYDSSLYRAYVTGVVNAGRGTEALDALGVLIHLDSSRATQYRLQRARMLRDLARWDEARAETVLLLEEMPHYWDAQELLLEVIENVESDLAGPENAAGEDESAPHSPEDPQ